VSFKIDFSKFNRQFDHLSKKFTGKYSDEAMFNALSALKYDADNIEPTTPKKEGTLRSSVAFEGKGSSLKSVAKLVWNMPYAAYQHEGKRKDGTHVVQNYSEPGSGAKYVDKKLEKRGKIYRDIMGRTFKSKI